jgi:uncharacterized protein YcbK (DUF882 family)
MITLVEYFMGRDKKYPPSDEMLGNAQLIVSRVNTLLTLFGESRSVSSGYRPPEINASTPNASKKSKHMSCQAVDLVDSDGKLKKWCEENLHHLETIGLWMEDGASTPTWCHLQCLPPRSGNRIFKP